MHLNCLGEDDRIQVEKIAVEFEQAWQADPSQPPDFDGFLPPQPWLHHPVLVELIRLDIEYRLQHQLAVRLEDYLHRYPDLSSDQEAVSTLLQHERVQRRRWQGTGALEAQLPSVPGYELLGELGRGGMGVVYQARQLRLNRVVALKMILASTQAGPDDLTRFRAEAELVARLQHPHIVQIHDVGEVAGCPYLALEFVNGGSLAQTLGGAPLPARQAAALVDTLAGAVQYAHENGIIHRDLKPANVLLALSREPPASAGPALAGGSRLNDAVPRITDFGLAKRLGGETGLTRTGDVLGTPSYMAPEQAEGRVKQIGPATDIYALGAILYELLTGRPPFRGATAMETLLQVKSQEPVPLRRLQPSVPRDLETICLKCLHKEPHKRYGTAAALAEDLRRFIAGKPIVARPVGPVGRLGRWCRRRPAVAGLVATVVLAFVLGFVATAWQWARAEDKGRIADSNFRRTLQVADRFFRAMSDEVLLDEPGMEPVRKKLFGEALDFYRDFLREHEDDPGLRKEVALAHFRAAELARTIGPADEAAAAYGQAIDRFEKLARDNPNDPEYPARLALSYAGLAKVYDADGRRKESDQIVEKALALSRNLSDRFPQAIYRLETVSLTVDLSIMYRRAGRELEAQKLTDEAQEGLDLLAKAEPKLTNHDYHLAANYMKLGRSCLTVGQRERAKSLLGQALESASRFRINRPEVGRNRQVLAMSHHSLGELAAAASDTRTARTHWTAALKIQEKLTHDHPSVILYKANEAGTHKSLARLDQQEGKLESAAEHLKRAIELGQPLANKLAQSSLASTYAQLGQLYHALDRTQEAESAYQKGLDLLKHKPGETAFRDSLALIHVLRGRLFQLTGRFPQARADYLAACRLYEQLPESGPDARWIRLGVVHISLGTLANDEGQPKESLPWLKRAIDEYEVALKQNPGNSAILSVQKEPYVVRQSASVRMGEFKKAVRDLDRAIELANEKSRTLLEFKRAVVLAYQKGGVPAAADLPNYRKAAEQAKAAAVQKGQPASLLYDQAVLHALFLKACQEDSHLAPYARAKLAEEYRARAIQLLGQARMAGYFAIQTHAQGLKEEKAFDPLRSLSDFQKLWVDGGLGSDAR